MWENKITVLIDKKRLHKQTKSSDRCFIFTSNRRCPQIAVYRYLRRTFRPTFLYLLNCMFILRLNIVTEVATNASFQAYLRLTSNCCHSKSASCLKSDHFLQQSYNTRTILLCHASGQYFSRSTHWAMLRFVLYTKRKK